MGRARARSVDAELDLGRYELRRFGRRVKLEKKPMELLIYLVGRRDQLVSREDIVAKLWRSDLFVDTERNVNNMVRKIRTALGDNAAKPRFLETLHRVLASAPLGGHIELNALRHPDTVLFGQCHMHGHLD